MTLTYASYLKINELLELQRPNSDPPEHDEMLFIIIHQVYELWFRLLLHEFDRVKRDFDGGDLYAAIAAFQRARTVMKTLVSQLDILETMTPMSFSSFRDRLEAASGFQSVQFRELEFLLGYKRPAMLDYYVHDSNGTSRLRERLREDSVVDCWYRMLGARGIEVPEDLLGGGNKSEPTEPSEALQERLVEAYRIDPELRMLLELMTDFDEGLQEWRYRHVKMVERTIGNKRGTGGSPGAEFLKRSLFKPLFPDLWAIRHRL